MKTLYFILVSSILFLASCGQDEVITPSNPEIWADGEQSPDWVLVDEGQALLPQIQPSGSDILPEIRQYISMQEECIEGYPCQETLSPNGAEAGRIHFVFWFPIDWKYRFTFTGTSTEGNFQQSWPGTGSCTRTLVNYMFLEHIIGVLEIQKPGEEYRTVAMSLYDMNN